MSSLYVRDQVKQYLADNSAEDVIDLTAEFQEFKSVLAEYEISPDAPWLGLEFIGDNELPVSLAATNDQGLYREFGTVAFHIAAMAKIGVGNSIIQRGEVLRNLFTGARIGDIVIEEVTPVNTGLGATLEFEGGYVSGTFRIGYYRDRNL